MFKQLFTSPGTFKTRILLLVALFGCLIWLGLNFFPRPGPSDHVVLPQATGVTAAPRKLEGDSAHAYLQQTSEGQSLMKALATARFGLERREKSPFEEDTGAGYLGMSHDENLNAWFDNEGVTVRPTLPEQERGKSWQLRMSLRAYGYGADSHEVRKQTAPTVKENRIEYERSRSDTGARVVEWYVNKAEGIEQGFTIDERPGRRSRVPANGPLRLAVSITGDLRASASKDGQSVELHRGGACVLTYSKLTASDATGKMLPVRMETNVAGDEVALVVDDASAQYPIVVDPITATPKQELAGGVVQAEARFGFSVSLDFFYAAVGAWREDVSGLPDAGAVYVFFQSGNNWTLVKTFTGELSGWSCGWSVDVSGNRIVFGCPGAESGKGRVYTSLRDVNGIYSSAVFINPGSLIQPGDRYGESVAVNGPNIVAGAPFQDSGSGADAGALFFYVLDSNQNIGGAAHVRGSAANDRFGTSVEVNGKTPDETIIVGSPGSNGDRGEVYMFEIEPGSITIIRPANFGAADGAPGDLFGNSVALDGNTLVVGAPGDDNSNGTDSGAAYVFTRFNDTSFSFFQEQKLTAGDGRTGDFFSEHAVAVEGNTVVVGAYANGEGGDPINGIDDDNRGAAYVFTRSNGVWSQQTKISQGNFAGGEAGDSFGIDVDIKGRTVMIGARAASSGSTLRAGAAFIYELNCLPPNQPRASFVMITVPTSFTACPGTSVSLGVDFSHPATYQWRKDGSDIPGATGAQLFINNISASDAGSYDVLIITACGSNFSTFATLNVHTLNINPTSQNFSASGSNGIVNVSSSGSCGWTATSNASWIGITSGASGTGNGTVGFTIAANTGAQRTGTLTIVGQTFTVMQDGTVLSPMIFTEEGTNNVAAVNSVSFVRGPFRLFDPFNFSADQRTRIIFFTSDLGLTQPNPSVLTVQASGANLPVENVGPLLGVPGLTGSHIVVRLPDGLPTGPLQLTVTLRGVMSNVTTLNISP